MYEVRITNAIANVGRGIACSGQEGWFRRETKLAASTAQVNIDVHTREILEVGILVEANGG